MRSLFTLSIALLAASCGTKHEPAKSKASPAPAAAPVRVQTTTAQQVEWTSAYEATGTVRARTTATISAKLMSYAREVNAQAGDRVREGQVLVVLDARDLDTSVKRAESARQEVKSAMPEADSAVEAAKAQAELAQVTFNRLQDLFQKKSATNQEFDEAAARLKAARAAVDMARARRAQLDSKLQQAEQEVSAAGITRAYTQITAPFSGVILTRSIEPGTLAVPGAPLFTMEREGGFRLEAAVEESRLGSVRVGQMVAVTLDGIGREINARVVEIVPTVDAATRSGTVKIDLPSMPGLRTGLFGRAAFPQGARRVLAIPSAAIVERGQLTSAFVVDSGTAQARLVTLGLRQGDFVEVLSGVNSGETIVSPVPAALADGAIVEAR